MNHKKTDFDNFKALEKDIFEIIVFHKIKNTKSEEIINFFEIESLVQELKQLAVYIIFKC